MLPQGQFCKAVTFVFLPNRRKAELTVRHMVQQLVLFKHNYQKIKKQCYPKVTPVRLLRLYSYLTDARQNLLSSALG